MHVLLVLDDKLAHPVKAALAGDAHTVLVAPTSAQALALAKRRPPNLVVHRPFRSDDESRTFRESLDARCPGKTIAVLETKAGDTVDSILERVRRAGGEAAGGAERDAAAAAAAAAAAGPTVLLLDDRGVARKHLAAAIAGEGWRVLEAADAREATLKILDECVDCFLLPSMLGGQPSAGLVKSAMIVRDVHPHPFSIVVLVDAEEGAGAATLAKSGVDDVVAKSTATQVLVRRLATAKQLRDLRFENRRLREQLGAAGDAPLAARSSAA